MKENKIKLPWYLAIEVSKILEEEHNIERRTDRNGLLDSAFTTEELGKITSLKVKNPFPGYLDGVHLLHNLQRIEVETTGVTAHMQDKDIPSLGDKDIKSISKCVSLKSLSLINQAKVKWLDVTKLENLQTLIITHNQHLDEIIGMDKLKKLWQIDCYGNNRLFNVGGLEKVIVDNSELSEVNLDILLFPETIGYSCRTGEYNGKAVDIIKELSEIGQIKWCESLNGNRAIKINNSQMIQMHNKACEILEENVSNTASTRDIIIGIENYLSRNVRYDYDAIKNGHSNSSTLNVDGKEIRLRNGPKVGANGAYNALTKNICVCEGYTRGMQYLLKLKGINSHNVDCYAEKDTTHMADEKNENRYTKYRMPDSSEYHSIICIDDYDCLYSDPCWNACRYQSGDKSMPWLLKTKEEISQDHTLSFDERVVSNNHLFIPSDIIQKSIRNNSLFIESKTRILSINATKGNISREIKGQIHDNRRDEI